MKNTNIDNLVFKLRQEGKTFTEISREVGRSYQRVRQIFGRAERQNYRNQLIADEISSLSIRSQNALNALGLQTKKQIREAIICGKLRPSNKEIPALKFYGKKSHLEIMDWIGCPWCGRKL